MAHPVLTALQFHNEEAAFEHVEKLLWPTGPTCPHCGATREHVGKLKGKATRLGAAAFDKVGDTRATEATQRGPHREGAGSTRAFGCPVDAIAAAGACEVGRGQRHCRLMAVRVRAQHDAAVVGHVEPFVGVGCPGVGELHTVE